MKKRKPREPRIMWKINPVQKKHRDNKKYNRKKKHKGDIHE